MVNCRRWENLYSKALSDGNNEKALEFKEKLVECIVYSISSLLAEKNLRKVNELMEYGMEVSRKYNIPELEFHLKLAQKEIERILKLRGKIREDKS
ncbi:MAG: hypothetical protein B6V02_03360 [Thermoprotei archaeon ex4572_64]|nr:MAG: hypothetical protein B6V02_03360 [Thermoprotei archaeon ex4572_64]